MNETSPAATRNPSPEPQAVAWTPGRRIFRDEALHRKFVEKGVVVVRLLGVDEAQALRRAFVSLNGDRAVFSAAVGKSLPNHQTQLSEDRTYRDAAATLVRNAIDDPVSKLLSEFRVVSAGMVVKAPGGGGTPLHSDWTLTRDPDDVAVTIWCPLIDVDEGNGGLQVVPGSHRLVPQISGPSIREYHNPFQQKMTAHTVSIPLQAGEAVVFDHTLLHCSSPNASDAERPALMLSCVAADADAVYYRPAADDEQGPLEMLAWPADGCPGSGPDAMRATDIEIVPNPNRPVRYEDYRRLFEQRSQLGPRSGGDSVPARIAAFFRKMRIAHRGPA